jgi:ribonuclease HI
MYRELNILQANVGKRSGAQDAMYNDEDLWRFDAILIQEPNCYRIEDETYVTGVGMNWELVLPKVRSGQGQPFRSCIWMSRSSEYIQVEVGSPDITAVRLKAHGHEILLVSVYIPTISTPSDGGERGTRVDEHNLRTRMQLLQTAIEKEKEQCPGLELVIAGDFNRHDLLWGGEEVGLGTRQGEAQGIREFIETNDLQLLLPRGTITWERDGIAASTIDLVCSSERLFSDRVKCSLFNTEYGSDHRVIHTSFALDVEEDEQEAVQPTRYLLKKANWGAVRNDISETLRTISFPVAGLDEMNEYLVEAVQRALRKHCPRAQPSMYTKRWWTADLTALRKTYTIARNRARTLRRQGRAHPVLEQVAKQRRHEFHHAIRKQKKEHWLEFLDQPSNIWTAAKYLDPVATSGFARIASITAANGEHIQDKGRMAKELLENFFPSPPTPQQSTQDSPRRRHQLFSVPLTKDEIYEALTTTSPDRAPGMDGLTTRVWKETWPVLQDQIFALFKQSLHMGKLPRQWKVAKIVPLRKGGKDDYTLPQSYRPISLLSTLGKVMEAVLAERISYLVETNGLLPRNHFGARKQRSTTHALSYLQEQIFNAWRGRKTLSLVSFDVKGAYNNVAKGPELERLRRRQIPEELVRWVDDFCTDRKACITVNGHTSEVHSMPQSGLPQGSPLSPILFLFFNADLVQTRYRNGGSMAYVDDYTAWVVGESAADNTRRIQNEILPILEKWERESGAVFEASKTAFIHFTRMGGARDAIRPLRFREDLIEPKEVVKILGVMFDQGLRFKHHIAKVAGKAYKAALALKRLKGLRPSSVRQLFSATVAPVMDYASPIWYLVTPECTIKMLEQAQRVAAQAIICSFRTVAIAIAEAEAGIPSLRQRLHDQTTRFWIGLHRLEASHPHHKLVRNTGVVRRFQSPLRKAVVLFSSLRAERTEVIKAFTCAPWARKPEIVILESDRAKETAAPQDGTADIYTDGSVRKNRAGIGVWSIACSLSKTTKRADETSVHLTELEAIHTAIQMSAGFVTEGVHTRVFTDSKMALQSIQRPKRNYSQRLVREIRGALRGKPITLHWIPGHQGIEGNEKAHELAQKATESECDFVSETDRVPISTVYALAKRAGFKPKVNLFDTSKTGRFTKKVDKALPGRHTRLLYDNLCRTDAAILAQLRTGMARLNEYLSKIAATETDECECGCGVVESVVHFLFTCPKWSTARQSMRTAHKDRFGELSFALGGYSTYERNGRKVDGEKEQWKPNMKAVRATIAFARATKRLDYVPSEVATSQPS